MTRKPRKASSHATSVTLNRLIVACNDDIRAHRAAAAVVRSPSRGRRLEESAQRRADFVEELGSLVRSGGGLPLTGGSLSEDVRALLRAVRTLVVGENSGDAYGWCARIEADTETLYERACVAGLPGPVREVVARQHAEIASDRAELRLFGVGG